MLTKKPVAQRASLRYTTAFAAEGTAPDANTSDAADFVLAIAIHPRRVIDGE